MESKALYLRPWKSLQASFEMQVMQSVKLLPGRLVCNRYFLQLDESGRSRIPGKLDWLANELEMPDAALSMVREYLVGREVTFIGAGEQGGKIGYKIYLGFVAALDATHSFKPVSVEWFPGNTEFNIKQYDRSDSIEASEAHHVVSSALMRCTGSLCTPASLEALYRQCFRILERTDYTKHFLAVGDAESDRVSYDFSLVAGEPILFHDIREELNAISRHLYIPPGHFRSWLDQLRKGVALEHLGVGCSGENEPFVTYYYTLTRDEPVYFVVPEEPAKTSEHAHARKHAAPSMPAVREPVFILGQISCAFRNKVQESRFRQQAGIIDFTDDKQVGMALARFPGLQDAIVWVIRVQGSPAYVLRPQGANARAIEQHCLDLLISQADDGIEVASFPGVLVEPWTFADGSQLPAIVPEYSGMFYWTTNALVNHALNGMSLSVPETGLKEVLANFLHVVYHRHVNPGVSGEDRAINYAGTNLLPLVQVFSDAIQANLRLTGISVAASANFYLPQGMMELRLHFGGDPVLEEQAQRLVTVTVDVRETLPVFRHIRQWPVDQVSQDGVAITERQYNYLFH